jgi:hypothetical protein
MEFYTVPIRQSAGYWVSLCLENGIVGQENNQQESIDINYSVYLLIAYLS